MYDGVMVPPPGGSPGPAHTVTVTSTPNAVAFIPARHGSKRVPGKNTRPLAGHPMLAYTIAPALESGVFSSVIVSTDAEETAVIARHYGAEVPFLRPAAFSGDTSPDIEWLEHALTELKRQGRTWDAFSLLRPTSPFRSAATIRRAWEQFVAAKDVDSLRAVEKCGQHPGKMWVVRGDRMVPLLSPAAKGNLGTWCRRRSHGTARRIRRCRRCMCRTRRWKSPGRAWCSRSVPLQVTC